MSKSPEHESAGSGGRTDGRRGCSGSGADGEAGRDKDNNNNNSDRYTSDDDLEAGPLVPKDIEE